VQMRSHPKEVANHIEHMAMSLNRKLPLSALIRKQHPMASWRWERLESLPYSLGRQMGAQTTTRREAAACSFCHAAIGSASPHIDPTTLPRGVG
jgi:cytochrome c553